MGKDKKNLEDLKKDLKTLNKEEMTKIVGGRNGKSNKSQWNDSCGGILPQ